MLISKQHENMLQQNLLDGRTEQPTVDGEYTYLSSGWWGEFFFSIGEALISTIENKGEGDVIDGDCKSVFNWLNVLSDFADMNFTGPKRRWKLKYFSNT